MSFWHLVFLIVLSWFLVTVWFGMYFNYRQRSLEMELKITKAEAGWPPAIGDED